MVCMTQKIQFHSANIQCQRVLCLSDHGALIGLKGEGYGLCGELGKREKIEIHREPVTKPQSKGSAAAKCKSIQRLIGSQADKQRFYAVRNGIEAEHRKDEAGS